MFDVRGKDAAIRTCTALLVVLISVYLRSCNSVDVDFVCDISTKDVMRTLLSVTISAMDISLSDDSCMTSFLSLTKLTKR